MGTSAPSLMPTTSAPTPVPTPNPTRTPIVTTSVGMSNINCTGFDAEIFNLAMDSLLSNSTFSDTTCTDGADNTLSARTEVATPRVHITQGENLLEHVQTVLGEAVSTGKFLSTIIDYATDGRRLGAGQRRLSSA